MTITLSIFPLPNRTRLLVSLTQIGQAMSHTADSSPDFFVFFSGAPVVYRTRFQPTISQSSTEAEFIAAFEAGKLALYLHSILINLKIEQHAATPLYEDNTASMAMANASRPTSNTPVT